MSKGTGDDTVGPWAREKLESLGSYLNYYTTRLKNQHWCTTWYIDAFAGPGMSPVRQPKDKPAAPPLSMFPDASLAQPADVTAATIEFLKGSPRVALEVKNPFHHYLFIERDGGRLAALEDLKAEFAATRDVAIVDGEANAAVLAFIASGRMTAKARGIVFLDPFGMNLPWSTLEAIAGTKRLEIIVNFPFAMGINRLLTTDAKIEPYNRAKLDLTFGCGDWWDLAYETTRDMLGHEKVRKRSDTTQRVLAWYQSRLRQTFGFASPPQLVNNTRGNPLYHLFWAGPNAAGLTGAHHVLTKPSTKAKKAVVASI